MIRTQDDLYAFLNNIFPTCFYSWQGKRKVPSAPYICYIFDGSDNFGADNEVYHKANNFLVELYIDKSDLTSEETLENAFDIKKIYYNKISKAYIDELKLFQVVYAINI